MKYVYLIKMIVDQKSVILSIVSSRKKAIQYLQHKFRDAESRKTVSRCRWSSCEGDPEFHFREFGVKYE